MSEQETMRLVAEVVDKYSGPLKQMMDSLKQIGASAKDVHEKGTKQTAEHEKAYRVLRDQLVNLKTKGIDVARPALSEMGVSVLTVSGALAAMGAAVVKSTKDWADFGQQLTFAHRSSGLQIDSLRGLAEANERFGVSQDATIKSLEDFGQHMSELGRMAPDYLNAWRGFVMKDGHTLFSELGEELLASKGDREEQLKKAMEFIPKIRDVDQRKRVLALLGLPENWATLTEQEMGEMRRRAEQFSHAHPFSAENAKKMKDAWEDVRTSMRGVWNDMGNAFGPGATSLVHGFGAALENVDHWLLQIKEHMPHLGTTPDLPIDRSSAFGRLLFGEATPNARVTEEFDALGTKKETEESVARGTTRGMLDALRQWKSQSEDHPQFAPGLRPQAFHPDETRGSTAPHRFGSPEFPLINEDAVDGIRRKFGNPSVAPSSSSSSGPAEGTPTSGSLAEQRKRFAEELNRNPALRDKVMRIAANEQGSNPQGTQAVIESMMNRAAVRGTSLEQAARWYRKEPGGYYEMGNMGRGALENAKHRAVLEQGLRNALAGSNISNYATDNSSGDLARRERATGKFRYRQDFNGETFFAPGWAEKGLASRWDKWHEQVMAADQTHGARLRDMVSRGHRTPGDAELLRRGMKTVDPGDLTRHRLDVSIDVNGLPRGGRAAHRTQGNLFRQVKLNRGRPMNAAREE